jgi:hypothetical protein
MKAHTATIRNQNTQIREQLRQSAETSRLAVRQPLSGGTPADSASNFASASASVPSSRRTARSCIDACNARKNLYDAQLAPSVNHFAVFQKPPEQQIAQLPGAALVAPPVYVRFPPLSGSVCNYAGPSVLAYRSGQYSSWIVRPRMPATVI